MAHAKERECDMRYAVIGAGGLGIQCGVLLQEFADTDVDFSGPGKPSGD